MNSFSSSASAPSKLDFVSLPVITLYGDLNMRPFRNIWMLQELQLPYKHIPCKPWSRIAKLVHPLGKVPALLVEYPSSPDAKSIDSLDSTSFVVLESAAINTFLGDLSREHDNVSNSNIQRRPTLVPPPATQERAKYDSLVSFIMTEIDFQSLWIHRKHSDLANVFGEAPVAVKEAKRQFDNALRVMEDELHLDAEECTYLLPGGFSGADILFANCCFWAQQIGWLERKVETLTHDGAEQPKLTFPHLEGEINTSDDTMKPLKLSPKLEAYSRQCRSRPAFIESNRLRKSQDEQQSQQKSKL
jgi:glutathione S-transferase